MTRDYGPFYEWENPWRKKRQDPNSICETFEDWKLGRRATGTCYGYRWVFPGRNNRTKEEWPYSYSDHYLWGHGQGDLGVSAAYSDRLSQWDGNKYREAFNAVSKNDGFNSWSAERCSDFLTRYFGKETTCVGLSEGCNQSTGYPYWVFYYKQEGNDA